MKSFLFALLSIFIVQLSFANNGDWGKTGHRATAEIAEAHLSKKAQKAIDKLLNGRSLAFVANYADDIKSDPKFRQYGPWHYVNIDPEEEEYNREEANPRGDLVQAIEKCTAVLKDENASKEDKQFFLKMLIHFMGDLHQPFHAGRSEDKGGNDIQVRWFGDGTNIHSVWDSKMINSFQMSYTELAENTNELSKEERAQITSGNLLDWVYESRDLADELYASVDSGEKLGYDYMYKRFPLVLEQLQKGGLRLAEVLNEIYK
ncbi:S1/P1 nuclease [Autumnicola psychrophila]|uniref:S1/P1 nuclease n=1 Tax=Autumnicola psychrophila TaxID=3075592 RepID=A0ABU3DSS9_9FLAO|nr:S1/P1 nuclease [Zunongwangia sp. F225]MDT0686780.1 S1/P1 nuclease [Zunongwangia sp. F225]